LVEVHVHDFTGSVNAHVHDSEDLVEAHFRDPEDLVEVHVYDFAGSVDPHVGDSEDLVEAHFRDSEDLVGVHVHDFAGSVDAHVRDSEDLVEAHFRDSENSVEVHFHDFAGSIDDHVLVSEDLVEAHFRDSEDLVEDHVHDFAGSVDARLVMDDSPCVSSASQVLKDVAALVSHVCSPQFYGPPIELEPEGHLDVVGVRVSVHGVRVQGLYIVRGFDDLFVRDGKLVLLLEHRWRYRSCRSGGSPSAHLVGFTTRAHQALRLSFPVSQGRRASAQLVAISLALDLDSHALTSVLRSLSKIYPSVLSELLRGSLIHALRGGYVEQIIIMGI